MTPERLLQLFEQQREAFKRIPVSTYRVQLGPHFRFADLTALLPYLDDLGITDCYLSPFFLPCGDRSHGYDVADHGSLNPALGDEGDLRALAEAARARGMGLLADVVPNHMGIAGSRNAWWFDVLENGPASLYADFFDIDWDPMKPELKNKVLLPILGDQYGRVLENGELVLELRDGAFVIRYYDTLLPVAPRSYVLILRHRLAELEAALGAEDPHLLELQSIITALSHLPPRTETDPERRVERNREKQVVKRRLDALVRESPALKAFVEENLRLFNGVRGEARSFDLLDELLADQAYRLAFWQVATDEINYRRFFDINELAAIRMEEPQVFEAAHRLLFRLIREGAITGLRVDHPDGLFAPGQYFRSLQRGAFLEVARRTLGAEAEAEGWEPAARAALEAAAAEPGSPLARPFYIVAEKILMPEERLPEEWPVEGTTGYEFLNALNGLFVLGDAQRALDETYAAVAGTVPGFREVVYDSKKLITVAHMSSELIVLGHRLARIAQRQRTSRDFTDRSLTHALREVIACFPVYRTYVGDDGEVVPDRDRRYIEQAVALARRRNPATSGAVFDFLRDLLTLRHPEEIGEGERQERLAFVRKFQQLTGPITAKGVEDTALYRFTRLVSLNEVGGSPERFGVSLEEFHQRLAERGARSPAALSATSTHDTKRGEDVRARINVLSEIPQEWRLRVRRWRRLNKRKKTAVHGQPAPDGNEEYLLYQTLVGAWPAGGEAGDPEGFAERIRRYTIKALREAKLHSSWLNPDPEYEAAIERFVTAILDPGLDNPFLEDFLPFQQKVAACAIYASLSQTLVKLAAPGVPDFYQGSELWDLNLVDPDNRRPVDYAPRRRMLDALVREAAAAGPHLADLARRLLEEKEDGRVKLFLIHRALAYRRRHARLFLEGEYLPLEAGGARREHVVGFARRTRDRTVVAVAPRFLARLSLEGPPLAKAAWGDTWLLLPQERPGARYLNLLTGEAVEAGEREGRPALPLEAVLASFPVSLLEAEA